jgi:glucosamine kinase
MSDALYLGIDGGGTTSRARLADAEGRILGEGRAGSSNLTLGIDVAQKAIREATDKAFAAAGLPVSRQALVHAGLGLAGANVPWLAAEIGAAAFPFSSVSVASDAVAACLGAHDGQDGAILILGTGSQGLAIVGGQATAIGGWGFALGDDGSGAILGRAAIRAALLSHDGLAPSSALTGALLSRFHGDPGEAVVWARSATPRDYGGFAPLIFEHARSGDAVARGLIAESAASVATMLERLASLGAHRIALMGGLAEPIRPFLATSSAALLVVPRGDALDGALALARRGAPR